MRCLVAAPAVPFVAVDGVWKLPTTITYRILELRAASVGGNLHTIVLRAFLRVSMLCLVAAPAVPFVAVESMGLIPITITYRILELRAAAVGGNPLFFFRSG